MNRRTVLKAGAALAATGHSTAAAPGIALSEQEDPRSEVRRLANRISDLLDQIDDYERVVICARSVGKWAVHTQFTVDPSEMPDHKILELAKTFEEAFANEEAVRKICQVTGDWSGWDAAYARTASIVELIEKEPATTMEGLRAKARCIQWCYGDDPVDLVTHDTTDDRLATQIVNSLLNI